MRKAVERRRRLGRMPCLALLAVAVLLLVAVIVLRMPRAEQSAPKTDEESALCVVCIDPGHGGSDMGASWEGRLEKDDDLALALALRDALTAKGVRCVLTRETDESISLEDRVAFAEEQEADYYISLHRNYAEADACGVEVWVAQSCSETAMALAQSVQEGLVSVGVQSDRGVRQGTESGEGDYYVLRHTSMPAILIELGFLQNEEDNDLLDRYMDDYAAAIADAVCAIAEEQDGES